MHQGVRERETSPKVVVAALEGELRGIRRRCRDKAGILLLRSGIGPKAMAEAIQMLFSSHPNSCSGPVLHIGFCGGIAGNLKVGDLVIADKIIDRSTQQMFFPPRDLISTCVGLVGKEDLPFHRGVLVTSERMVSAPAEKRFLHKATGALAVDMESAAFAAACEERQISYAVVRAISDSAEMPLPHVALSMRANGTFSVAKFLRQLARHPQELFILPQIGYASCRAQRALTRFATSWIAQP